MIRILFLAGIVLVGTAAVCSLYLGFSMFTMSSAATPAPEHPKIALYDVDAMAARMTKDKNYYSKVRDDALSFYARQHPASAPYNEEAKMVIRLAAYFVTWGDFYGERVLLDLADIEQQAENKGLHEPLFCNLQMDGWEDSSHPSTEGGAVEECNEMTEVAKDAFPTVLKFWGYESAILATLQFNDAAGTTHKNPPSMQKVPHLVSLWGECLKQLIADKAPDHVIFDMPMHLMEGCESDENTLNQIIAAIDRAYNEAGVDVGGRLALDGDYFTRMAWAARGSGYANTVSNSQFETFGRRLQQAQLVLEAAYSKYPNEPRIPVLMLVVALGGSLDAGTVEMWFQRAIKADPNFYNAYQTKEWYLQPRWFGNVDDEWKFIQQCIATQNWANKVPMVIAPGLNNVVDNGDPDIFTRDDVWQVVNSTYRKYLDMYPRASRYRTYFLRAAYLGHHPDVMKEQYKILGTNWDSDILMGDEYKAISSSIGK